MGKIKQTIRKDGLRIITKRLSYTKKVMFSVTSLMGGAHDKDEHLGIAHFFEHMVFQGTKKRDRLEIQRDLDNCCISHNADTCYLRTRYFGVSAKPKFAKMAEVILDLYCNPIFLEDRIVNEKNVVAEEILRSKDDPSGTLFDGLIDVLYQPQNRAVREILGSVETLSTIDRDLLFETHNIYYAPANSVVIVTGDIAHKDVVAIVKKYFPIRGKSEPRPINIWKDESGEKPCSSRVNEYKRDRETALIAIGCKLKNTVSRKRRAIERILMEMLSQMLFEELRQKHGLVYGAYAGLYEIMPLFRATYAYAETGYPNLEKALGLMMSIIKNMLLQEEHFEEVKDQILTDYSVNLETCVQWNEAILHKVLNGEDAESLDLHFENIADTMKQIGFDDVVSVRNEIFSDDRISISILTRFEEKE